jgi:DNA-binding IclR family transcriptional regulator
MSKPETGSNARIPTLRKMSQLLDLFTPDRPSWRVPEMAATLEWDGATTHRFARALAEIGMLDVDGDHVYRVGVLPQRLSAVANRAHPRRRVLMQRLGEIAEATELTTQVGVIDRGEVVIIASHEGSGALNAAAKLGERLPLHATAVGKSILGQLPESEVREMLPATLPKLTEKTVTSRDELMAEIRGNAGREFAVADSELSQGVYAVAVPLPEAWFGGHAAALACIGPSREFMPDQWDKAEVVLSREGEAVGLGSEETVA